ncbi:MAG: hypothetical protein J6C75_00340 [Oscillospiraceae bacterium]|nr:hypothetical protein [Oscillospiraceae bacterium]
MKDFFPLSAKSTDAKNLVISILLYVVISIAIGFVLGFFTGIPLIGTLIKLISGLADLYCLAGIVVSIMIFAKVV